MNRLYSHVPETTQYVHYYSNYQLILGLEAIATLLTFSIVITKLFRVFIHKHPEHDMETPPHFSPGKHLHILARASEAEI